MTTRPERDEFSESVAEFMQRNRLKIDLKLQPGPLRAGGITLHGDGKGSLVTPLTEFISKELRTPEVDGAQVVSSIVIESL